MTETKIQLQIDKYGNENPKVPVREFDDRTGEFEYADPEIRKKSDVRKEHKKLTDELEHRRSGLEKHLSRAKLGDKFGKTGDSLTGKVSDEDAMVAKIQQEHTKIYIRRYRKVDER